MGRKFWEGSYPGASTVRPNGILDEISREYLSEGVSRVAFQDDIGGLYLCVERDGERSEWWYIPDLPVRRSPEPKPLWRELYPGLAVAAVVLVAALVLLLIALGDLVRSIFRSIPGWP
ncbi:MAG: hypothetical protein ACK5AZ_04260 [Bryobacteraceae bacterium]